MRMAEGATIGPSKKLHRAATKRQAGIGLSLALCVFGLSLAAPTAIANGDKQVRPRIDATDYPWHAFGRVNRQGSGYCTGVLVAPDVVLTAAHCLYDRRRGNWAVAERIHFVAAYQKQKFAFHSRARSYRVAEGFDPLKRDRTATEAGDDWAVVTLEKSAGPDLGYLGVARLTRKMRMPKKSAFTLAGYGRDRPYALSAHRGCRFLGWEENGALVLHNCQAARGTSGAPIILYRNGQYLIFALHVGRADTFAGQLGGAVPGQTFFDAVREATGRSTRTIKGGLAIVPGLAAELVDPEKVRLLTK